nr:hypothetical protein [Tanacetum cinerariifolium]
MEVLLGIHRVWDVVDHGLDDAKKNNIFKGLLFQSIPEDLVLQIGNLKTGKEMREAIKTRNLGADHVKETRLQTLITEFENMKMLDNGTIDEYAAKSLGIASKSAMLEEVMSEHKMDVVGRLKAYEERVKEEDKANDSQDNFLYVRTEYSNRNNDSSGGSGCNISVAHILEVVDEVEVKDVVGITRKTKVNVTPRKTMKIVIKRVSNMRRDLSHIQCYLCDQYGHFVSKCAERNRKHEVNLNKAQEKEKYTPPKSESNTDDEDDIWFEEGSCFSIKGKGLILFQGKNEEQKLLKDVYYIPALRSNVISLGQATISGYDISIRGDFLTMRDSWGSLLIKVPRGANRLYKAQLKVSNEGTNEVGRESDKEENPHSNLVTVHETNPESEDKSRSDDMSISIARLETIRLLIALAAGKMMEE